jgi:hypothetical protein
MRQIITLVALWLVVTIPAPATATATDEDRFVGVLRKFGMLTTTDTVGTKPCLCHGGPWGGYVGLVEGQLRKDAVATASGSADVFAYDCVISLFHAGELLGGSDNFGCLKQLGSYFDILSK